MRGRVKAHVEVLDSGFPGECLEGVAAVIAKVGSSINKRFQVQAVKPDHVMVDRGRGFYNPGTFKITAEYQRALKDHGISFPL